MTTIAPSLLSCDFLNIASEMQAFNGCNNVWFHLDIMDGHFVPNLTFGHPVIKNISSVATLPLDAHLMVSNPQFYIESLADYNLHNLTFHLEATDQPLELIKQAQEIYPSVGISIKPNTPANALNDEILSRLSLVLVMSVEPGFSGQKFMDNAYEKILFLNAKRKELSANYIIQVDGGVNKNNSHKLISCGADNMVAGSYVFKISPDKYLQQIDSLR